MRYCYLLVAQFCRIGQHFFIPRGASQNINYTTNDRSTFDVSVLTQTISAVGVYSTRPTLIINLIMNVFKRSSLLSFEMSIVFLMLWSITNFKMRKISILSVVYWRSFP